MKKSIDLWPLIDSRIAGTSWVDIGKEHGLDWRTVKSKVRGHAKKLKALETAMKDIE